MSFGDAVFQTVHADSLCHPLFVRSFRWILLGEFAALITCLFVPSVQARHVDRVGGVFSLALKNGKARAWMPVPGTVLCSLPFLSERKTRGSAALRRD